MARAMLLHFALHWPQAATVDLWPFAVDQAVYIWNHLPHPKHKLSPIEHFTSAAFGNHHHLQRLHVFGCPVFVLDAKLQDGKKLPKWERRSRRGVYLGVSKAHSSTVHLVLNPDTGYVSPQYHVIFDDTFSTVFSEGAFNDNVWNSLVASNCEKHPDAEIAVDITPFQPVQPNLTDTIEQGGILPHNQQPDPIQPEQHPAEHPPIQKTIDPPISRVRSETTAPPISPVRWAEPPLFPHNLTPLQWTVEEEGPPHETEGATPDQKPTSFNPTGGPISVSEGAHHDEPPAILKSPTHTTTEPRRSSRNPKDVDRLTFDKLGGESRMINTQTKRFTTSKLPSL